jgi:general secretion pathway protein G
MKKGFTLIEILLVVALIGILASTLVISVNPARQFAKARDTKRESDLYGILSAITQYAAEHSGNLPDTDGDPDTDSFPTTQVCIGSGGGCFNLAAAGDDGDTMVPVYMPQMPMDPKTGTPADTDYLIYVDANNRLVASASGETQTWISITR